MKAEDERGKRDTRMKKDSEAMTGRPPAESRRFTVADALARLPGAKGERFKNVFNNGSHVFELYAPRGVDPQKPHTRDEAYIVVEGSGEFVHAAQRERFAPGDFLFAAAGVVHRFENFTDDLVVWVIFYGPEGGEAAAPHP